MLATPSCRASSRKLSGRLGRCAVDVREMTLSEPILASRVRISSWMPTAKNAASFSELKFSNGSTAMEAIGASSSGTKLRQHQRHGDGGRGDRNRAAGQRRAPAKRATSSSPKDARAARADPGAAAPPAKNVKTSIVSDILASLSVPRETQRCASGPRIVRCTSAEISTEPGSLPRHQARRDVDAVAEQVAVRLHHDVAQMHADAHLGLARLGELERGLDGDQARAELQHEAVAGGVEHAPAVRAAMPSITLRSAATSAVVLASSASVRAE